MQIFATFTLTSVKQCAYAERRGKLIFTSALSCSCTFVFRGTHGNTRIPERLTGAFVQTYCCPARVPNRKSRLRRVGDVVPSSVPSGRGRELYELNFRRASCSFHFPRSFGGPRVRSLPASVAAENSFSIRIQNMCPRDVGETLFKTGNRTQ